MQTLHHRLANAESRPRPQEPVRIAFVITDVGIGGAEQALANLAIRLNRSRWEPRVFSLGEEEYLAEVLRRAGIPCTCLACSRYRPIQVIIRLSRALRDFQPAIVQSFLFHANLASRLAAPWAGRPWVVGGLRVAERRKSWHLVLDHLTAPMSLGSVCVSQGVFEFSRDVARLDPQRLTVIPNGIDSKRFETPSSIPRRELGIPEEAHLALFVGRLDVQKGIHDLLEAAERVITQSQTWHLALAGDGPLRTWLLEQIEYRPILTDRIHWLGMRNDIPSLLQASNVLVLPSLWEGMPNVVLEAMMARRPVVATSVEGTSELVTDGETGWLVPPGHPQELGAALLNAALSPLLCTAFGQKGYERVTSRFSIDRTVAAYDKLWTRLLGYQPP